MRVNYYIQKLFYKFSIKNKFYEAAIDFSKDKHSEYEEKSTNDEEKLDAALEAAEIAVADADMTTVKACFENAINYSGNLEGLKRRIKERFLKLKDENALFEQSEEALSIEGKIDFVGQKELIVSGFNEGLEKAKKLISGSSVEECDTAFLHAYHISQSTDFSIKIDESLRRFLFSISYKMNVNKIENEHLF